MYPKRNKATYSNFLTPPINTHWLMSLHESWPATAMYWESSHFMTLMMETGLVSETLTVLNKLMWLSAQEDFIAFYAFCLMLCGTN